ncbi:MAG: hypothetical protein Q9170_007723, partial [Blastenia crenularia]
NTLLALPSQSSTSADPTPENPTIAKLVPHIMAEMLLPLLPSETSSTANSTNDGSTTNSASSPFSEEEIALLPAELQLLPPTHVQENNTTVLTEIVEALYLMLARGGKEVVRFMKEGGSYAVLRELHVGVEDEGVRGACERCVDLLMREHDEKRENGNASGVIEDRGENGEGEEDEDDRVVDVF